MVSSRRKDGVAVVFALFVAVSGCKQILGLHERTEEVDAGTGVTATPDAATPGRDAERPVFVVGSCGSLSHPSQACADCMDNSCCTQAMACHDDASCDVEFDCLLQCGDDGACRARCTQFYNRADSLLEVSACREKSCAAECGLSCGGLGYSVPNCDTCVRSTCCALGSACAKNVECLKVDLCRSNCLQGSMTCPPECDATYPAGTSDYAAWLDCTQNVAACGAACQTGHGWECLDTPAPWPRPKNSGNFTFSVGVADLLSERPYVGAVVKACKKLDPRDPLCLMPLDQSVTDQNGVVSLTVPAGSVGFDGYLDITGGDNGAGQGAPSPIFPAVWYPTPPVISGGYRGKLQFVSTADLPLLGAITGADIDPTRGHLAVNALDCNFTPAAGVSFAADTADQMTRSFYFVSGVPSTSAGETDPQTGIGGFINLPANKLVFITATSPIPGDAGKKKMGSLTFNIRPGAFTTSSVPPVP